MTNITTGTKFFRFTEGMQEPEVVRVYKTNEETNEVFFITDKKEKYRCDYNKFIKRYSKLKPDGMIMFTIVEVDDIDDVIVSLDRLPSKYEDSLPFAVCRQSVYDFFSNIDTNREEMWVGVSCNRENCPANIDFKDVLTCTNMKYNNPVVVYIEDTLEDILGLFKHKKFDNTLRMLKEKSLSRFTNSIVMGYEETLKELLEANNFMFDFRKCFDIVEVPHPINPESEGLSIENILFLENEYQFNILETYLIPYSRDIDFSEIKRNYMIVASAADKYEKLYVVGYDKADGDYVPRKLV